MALKKSDLYRSLWRSCDELRGGMDASQYKDYILTLLFVKYVSDKAKADPDSLIEVPEGASFDDIAALRGDKEIGDKINTIIGALAEANDLVGVINVADFNDGDKLGSGKEMQDRLSKLVAIFSDVDFSGSRAQGDDLLGDAYEYLMQHFATESGKSKGQFYTPAEVSRIMARVVGIGPATRQDESVFDPTCGSGSLLLKAADEAPRGITIYGQEKDNATWALAKMNMILHGHATAEIKKGDTITSPQFTDGAQLRTFDYAVANPPFSTKSWDNGLELDFGRFEFGMPPKKNGDYAFLLHVLKSLKSTGKAAVILPHGVLFRGQAEAKIRRELVKRGYIKGIIGLPANLFFGTGIPACIVVLDKENAQARAGIFMIDASKGFKKDGAKNRLRSRDIHKIVDVWESQGEVERYSRMVPLAEIESEQNDFNLNLPRYIDTSEPEDIQDLHAHLHGGIPERDIDALQRYWDAFPSLQATLITANRPGYTDLAVDVDDVQQTILGSEEFKGFAAEVSATISNWYATHRPALADITATTEPNALISTLGDDLLARFRDDPLLDEYEIYEQLLSYWHETMHDDVFMLMRDGFLEASRPRAARVTAKDSNGKDKYEPAHITLKKGSKVTARLVMDLVPPELVIGRFLSAEKAAHEQAQTKHDEAAAALEQFKEEHAVDGGLAGEAVDDSDKVTAKSVKEALKTAHETEHNESAQALEELLELIGAEAAAKEAAKDALVALETAAVSKYGDLTEDDVREMVLDDKWRSTVMARGEFVVDDVVRNLIERTRILGHRYGETNADIEAHVRRARDNVALRLAGMGL